MPAIEEILGTARREGASDVHLMAGLAPKMRVNGRLTDMDYPKLQPSDTLDILVRTMSELQRESFEEQGQYSIACQLSGCGRFRMNAYRQGGNVALAFRVVPQKLPLAEELHIPNQVLKLSEYHSGLVLLTGAAGSGRSTTLAVLVDRLNESRAAHIVTLEEPVEYIHSHKRSIISQREIGTDTLSCAEALKGAAHEDADVIVIGELKDAESVREAVAAAEAGHLVLAAVPTGSTVGAFWYVVNQFPVHEQRLAQLRLTHVLRAAVSQKLLYGMSEEGCVPAFELLCMDEELKARIREDRLYLPEDILRDGEKEGILKN